MSNKIEDIIRFNINAALIHDDRIQDLVDALELYVAEQVVAGRIKEVERFARKYRPIKKPVKGSPLEFTEQAKYYNQVFSDIVLYESIRVQQLKDKQEAEFDDNYLGEDRGGADFVSD